MERSIRHKRIRAKVSGSAQTPRVAVFRSNRSIAAQVIDDVAHKTLLHARGPKTKSAKLGEELAGKAIAAGIKKIVFDRGGHQYHGHVKAFADGMRKGGLTF